MPRHYPILTTFNAGEWSPQLYGRVDLAKYRNACRALVNFVPLPQGPAVRRPGTRFIAETKSSGEARLIPFEFSTAQAYAIEAGNQYFRFYKDGGPIESPPGTAVEIATPYLTAQPETLKWAQSADVLYLAHPAHAPRKLSRTSHTTWTLTPIDFRDGPYLDENVSSTTLAPSATTGSIALAASAALFAATDVGRSVRLRHGSTWGWVRITAYTDATNVTATVMSTLGGATAVTSWRLGAWSDTTGWPACVSFYEERLVFANNGAQPQTLWSSVSGDYETFAPTQTNGTVTADSALTFTISDDRVNAVHWLSAGRSLMIGTSGGEFVVQASSLNEALTPENVVARRVTTLGSADQMAARVGSAVLYVQRARRKLFEMLPVLETDTVTTSEMSSQAHHLVREQLRQIVFQQEPWSVLWARRDDGGLLGFTYVRDQDVLGWHRHPIGGVGTKVQSICCIPGDGQDELWLVVERTIGGSTRRYVERMDPDRWPQDPDDKSSCFHVDCGLSYSGPATSVIGGLQHLAGETVQILADGAAHPDRGVSDAGQVELDWPASVVQVGLKYESRLETMDLEAATIEGTAQGRPKRINRVVLRFWSTLGARVGYGETLDDVLFRDASMPMNASPRLFTGDKVVAFPKGWDRAASVVVVQDQPLPCVVTAMMPTITTNEN